MHRELCQPYIDRVQRNARVRDVSERRASRHIGAVRVRLCLHSRTLAESSEDRRRDRVGRIVLICVVFYDDAAVHSDGVVPVGVFGMVGVRRVRVVARNEKARREFFANISAFSDRFADSFKCVRKERRSRALLRPAADLFVVEQTADGKTRALFRIEKSRQRRKRALKVVEPRRAYKSAEFLSVLRIVDRNIRRENVLLINSRRFGKPCAQRNILDSRERIQRKHIDRRVVAFRVVHRSVHVDRNVRYDRNGSFQIDSRRFHSVGSSDDDPARDRERSVRPC